MSEHIHRSHDASVLLYHLVCPAKYRRAVFSSEVDEVLKTVCMEISDKYDIMFLEIGTDKDHVHFLIQPQGCPETLLLRGVWISANEARPR